MYYVRPRHLDLSIESTVNLFAQTLNDEYARCEVLAFIEDIWSAGRMELNVHGLWRISAIDVAPITLVGSICVAIPFIRLEETQSDKVV